METTEEVIKLTPFEAQATELEAFAKDFKGLVVTRDNYKEMDEKRLVLYRKRIELQRIEKVNNDILNKAKKLNTDRSQKLIGIIKGPEDELAANLKKIDAEIEAEKNKEKTRIDAHKRVITDFSQRVISVMQISDSTELQKKKDTCVEWYKGYNAEEFAEELAVVYKSYLNVVDGLIVVAKQKEEEAKRVEEVNMREQRVEKSEEIVHEPIMAEPGAGIFEPMLRPLPVTTSLPESQVYRKSTMEFGVTSPPSVAVPNNEVDAFMEKAKAGEFSIGVAVNYECWGFKFYIDPMLSPESAAKIKEAIENIVVTQEGF